MKRSLKIEERGDFQRRKTFPGIRLIGQWLQRAGFPPGKRVEITMLATGKLQLEVQS